MLMFQRDTSAIPGWNHQQLYVATLDVRDPEVRACISLWLTRPAD